MSAGEPFPWAPLEHWRKLLGTRWLQRELRVPVATLVRWTMYGVPAGEADRVARALARDPSVDAAWLWKGKAA